MTQQDPIFTSTTEPLTPTPTTTTTTTTGGMPSAASLTAPASAYAGPAPTADAANLAMLAHCLDVIILAPLIIYFVKKDSHPFVADQSREALNFSITYFIAAVALSILGTILFAVIHVLGLLVSLASLALFVIVLVMGIMAGMKAKEGIAYRYPFAIRLIK